MSHLIVCFTAYTKYEALEQKMKKNGLNITTQKAIDAI